MDWKIVVAAPLVAWLVVANAAALRLPTNWGSDVYASTSHAYVLGLDPEVNFNGRPALAVRSAQPQRDTSVAALTKYIDAFGYEGRRVRLTGMLRTSDIDTWAGVFLQPVSGVGARSWMIQDETTLPHASASTPGTSDWHAVSVVIAVPTTPDASISMGLAVVGNGQAWVSDLKFEEVGDDVPLTETRMGLDVNKLQRENAEAAARRATARVKVVPDLSLGS